jgi:hypothetical protein
MAAIGSIGRVTSFRRSATGVGFTLPVLVISLLAPSTPTLAMGVAWGTEMQDTSTI